MDIVTHAQSFRYEDLPNGVGNTMHALCEEITRLRDALRDVEQAIASLPEEALGYAGDPRCEQPWPIRDELPNKARAALGDGG